MKMVAASLVVLVALLAAGCGGDGGSELPRGGLTCDIDGVPFPAEYAWFAARGAERVIYATTGDLVRSIWIQFDAPAALPATIALDNPANNWAVYNADRRTPGHEFFTTQPATGTLTITALTDTQCVGTFSFTAWRPGADRVTVTNGSFDLPAGAFPE